MNTAVTTRRQILALALPLTATLFIVGEALTPNGLDQSPMSTKAAMNLLPKATGHISRLYLSNALILLGLGALVISYLSLTLLVQQRGSRFATIAAAIGCLAAVSGIVANVLTGFNLATAISAHLPATQAARFIARSFSSTTGEAFLNVYFIGNIVALILMGVALWRSRSVPRPVAVLLLFTFELAAFAPAGPEAIPLMAPFLVISVLIARVIRDAEPSLSTPTANPTLATAISQ